jgi:hypothetical protein
VTDGRVRLREAELDWREVEGEVVALDVRTSQYLAVNDTGRLLWSALAEGATRDELVERLVEAHEIDRGRAAADVDAFVAELEARDLISRNA